MKNIMRPFRLFDIINCRATAKQRRPCFKYGNTELSVESYRRQVDALSHALLIRGLKRGEVVGLISENRPEWNVIDMAVMQSGGILLPLCGGLSAEEYIECINKANVRILFLENEHLYKRFRLILPQLDSLEYLLSIDPMEAAVSLNVLLDEGRVNAMEENLDCRRNMITADDVCALEYCGGGEYHRITHRAFLEKITEKLEAGKGFLQTSCGSNALCTQYGRMANYIFQYAGYTVNYPVNTFQ